MVPILCRISISAKEYVGHIQIYVVPIFIPLSSRSCGPGITTIVFELMSWFTSYFIFHFNSYLINNPLLFNMAKMNR